MRTALIARAAFDAADVDPSEYELFCAVGGEDVRVAISPAAHDYLKRLGEATRDTELIGALPFAQANADSRRRGGTYRLWATDFALLHGARTETDVEQWLAKNGVENRASTVGSLRLPESRLEVDDGGAEMGGGWWRYERSGLTFDLPDGSYRSGGASVHLFQQLLGELSEDVVKEIVVEAAQWAPEALRRFDHRSKPVHRRDESLITIEALLRAVGASWEEVARLGLIYRPPHERADLSQYLEVLRS